MANARFRALPWLLAGTLITLAIAARRLRSRTGTGGGGVTSRWDIVSGLCLHSWVSTRSDPDASVVVLVHGLGMSGRYMLPTLRRLAPDFRVYAPDLPGFGRSTGPDWALTVPELADALAGWMDAVGLVRAAFLANSLGCQVVGQLILRHPGRVTRAVFVAPTMDPRARNPLAQAWRLLRDTPHETPGAILIALWGYWQAGPRRIWGTLRSALRERAEDSLPRISVPVLVVRGSRDPVVPQGWAQEAARLLPHGRLIVIPGAPHAANYSTPEALVRAVRPFLDVDRAAGLASETG